MSPGNRKTFLTILTVAVIGGGCRHPTYHSPTPLATSGGGGMTMSLPEGSYRLPQLSPPEIDVAWMEATEFIPPGANVVVNKPLASKVRGTPKARYPSTAECITADGNAVVGLSSDKAAGNMHHRLLLYQRGEAASRVVLVTPNYFDVVWSVTGEHVAITEYVGRNTSDVLVAPRSKGSAARIDVRPVLEHLFRAEVLAAPRFQKAFGWLDGSHLVVRGMGRIQAPPYEVFGYELVIDANHMDDPEKTTVVAAFTKIYQR